MRGVAMSEIAKQADERPLVLVIAGLDSGGGAGVTADIITVRLCAELELSLH